MSIGLKEQLQGKVLEVDVTGKLTKEDYARFVPQVEEEIRRAGKVRILFRMHDFHGWEMAAAWEDTKFGFRHYSDIERLAVVGEKRWQKGMATFCKPFTKAKIRYFPIEQEADARAWLEEE